MAFITLTEAVDRVLARLADQREGKTGEAQHLPGKVARGTDKPARGGRPGCGHATAKKRVGPAFRELVGDQTPVRAGRPGGRRE